MNYLIFILSIYAIIALLTKSFLWPFINLPHKIIRTLTVQTPTTNQNILIHRLKNNLIPKAYKWAFSKKWLPKNFEWIMGLGFIIAILSDLIKQDWLFWVGMIPFAYCALVIVITAPIHYIFGLYIYFTAYKYNVKEQDVKFLFNSNVK